MVQIPTRSRQKAGSSMLASLGSHENRIQRLRGMTYWARLRRHLEHGYTLMQDLLAIATDAGGNT